MKDILIGVVGPCTAGKSTLIAGLRQQGYQVRHIAQEHSFAPEMWQKITHPDILIYLDVSYPVSLTRRSLNWSPKEYEAQQFRLRHARQNADLYLHTDPLTIPQVLETVLSFIVKRTSG
jgi:deoxyadenosine/deoxycytidine kinase